MHKYWTKIIHNSWRMYAIKDIKSATQIIKILVHHKSTERKWYTHKWGNKYWGNLSKKVVVSRSWSCVHWPMRRWLIWRAFLNAVLLLLCQAHQGWLILVHSEKIVSYKQWKDINNDSHSVCISPIRKKSTTHEGYMQSSTSNQRHRYLT